MTVTLKFPLEPVPLSPFNLVLILVWLIILHRSRETMSNPLEASLDEPVVPQAPLPRPPPLDPHPRSSTALLSSLTRHADPSTAPFLRAYSLGFAASVVPSLLKIILPVLLGKRKRVAFRPVLAAILAALRRGLSPRGLAMSFGVAAGGAKWGEDKVEPLVRKVYQAARSRVQKRREAAADIQEVDDTASQDRQEKIVKMVSTLVSSTIASLVAITILQSSPAYSRPGPLSPTPPLPADLDLGFSPYPSLSTTELAPTPSSLPPTLNSPPPFDYRVAQSPTLDLTLFILVRATDTIVRGIYEQTGVVKGRWGSTAAFLASHADTALFWLSTWRIMWCWFYRPNRLPPSYNRWIIRLARFDPRLLRLLQYARRGEYAYGRTPSVDVATMSAGIASMHGRSADLVNPEFIKRLDCSFVHGSVGGLDSSCEVNALKRWLRGFLDAFAIYLPVHLVPQLLFNLGNLSASPASSALRILLAASRSSAFLATFIASVYASVCLVRTRIAFLLPNISQQVWDSGLCTGLGCMLCGFSVLIENKRRRREMALYCAPRALYAMMDEIVPRFLSHGATGEVLSRWIERSIFALSTGTVITATVHRPDLVSGVVRGIAGLAVGDWGRGKMK